MGNPNQRHYHRLTEDQQRSEVVNDVPHSSFSTAGPGLPHLADRFTVRKEVHEKTNRIAQHQSTPQAPQGYSFISKYPVLKERLSQ